MTEQQNHLAGLLEQRQTLVNEINELNNKAAQKKELVLRALGAIEYLQQIGVTVPTAEEAAAEVAAAEVATVEPEVTEPPAEG
tara:strand:+ start:423 stop:671 length:249 start_codon:yes stop_codon:yes gene_type:complete